MGISLAMLGSQWGCQRGRPLTLENRTETLMTVRLDAQGSRTLEIDHEDVPDAERLGQQRFANRPSSGLIGLSGDRRSFGPMRINPGEVVRFRIIDPKNTGEEPSGLAVLLRAAPILSSHQRDIVAEFFEPLPALVVISEDGDEYRFEVSDEYAPAFQESDRN